MNCNRLKDLRLYEGVSQKKIAEVLDCHLHTYRKYENVSCDSMLLKKALILARFYNVSLNYLFLGIDTPKEYCIDVVSVTKRMKYVRKKSSLTQNDIANRLFCSVLTYKRYETGTCDIPMGFLISLSNYYKIALDTLVGAGNIQTISINIGQ